MEKHWRKFFKEMEEKTDWIFWKHGKSTHVKIKNTVTNEIYSFSLSSDEGVVKSVKRIVGLNDKKVRRKKRENRS